MAADPLARTTSRTAVIVISKSPATRAGIRLALEPTADCYEAQTAAEAIRISVGAYPSVCLVSAETGDEESTVLELAKALPFTNIIVLTNEVRDERLLAAIQAGAVGYLPQELDPSRLPFVVRGVLRGEAAIPRTLVTRLVDELRERRRRRRVLIDSRGSVDLTPREWEVLELLRQGEATKEIARNLSITDVTVRRHIGTLLRKLEVDNRREAIALMDDWTSV